MCVHMHVCVCVHAMPAIVYTEDMMLIRGIAQVLQVQLGYISIPYLPEYKSTFYDPKWMVKSRPRLIHRIIKLR